MAGAKVSFRTGQGGLPLVRVEAGQSSADIYLHGAHVTHFQRHGQQPLLFLSRESVFASGKAIRGGIPVILPWFGSREGQAAHGFARTQTWDLQEVSLPGQDAVRLRFRLPESEPAGWPRFVAEYEVQVGATLELALKVTNVDKTRSLDIETCLHTYFAVSDIGRTEVCGLHGVNYLDALNGYREETESHAAITFTGEVDRVYFNSPQTVEIIDHGWKRVIVVEKRESLSTVVWNPWIAKARRLTDFADDEYQRMVCVESGNVKQNQLQLAPGASATLGVTLDSQPHQA
jgi:glucose-6-phosphate 1-epimerase